MSKEMLNANLYEYQLKYLIRGHSVGGNLNDKTSRVNDAAFELLLPSVGSEYTPPSIDDATEHTNLLATCGSNIINLIDTETGKIVKRFNDDMIINKVKETYLTLDWTILNNSSVLVAGGEHGQVKVILPKYSACIARIEAHKRPIRLLKFDYKYKNILFSASDDHKINIWKLDIKENSSSLDCECLNELIGVVEYNQTSKHPERVLSMCFIPNRYLLIATELGSYYVKVNIKKLFKQKERRGESKTTLGKLDENVASSNESAIQFMMTSNQDNNKKDSTFSAEKFKVENNQTSSQQQSSGHFLTNTFIYNNGLLYANSIDSKHIHVMEIIDESELDAPAEENQEPATTETGWTIKARIVNSLSLSEDKFSIDNRIGFINDHETRFIIKTSSDGRFHCAQLDATGRKCMLKFKYELPNDYVIKPVNLCSKTEVKNYDLFERPTVLYTPSNRLSIAAITNQNIIAIFNRFKPLNFQIDL